MVLLSSFVMFCGSVGCVCVMSVFGEVIEICIVGYFILRFLMVFVIVDVRLTLILFFFVSLMVLRSVILLFILISWFVCF